MHGFACLANLAAMVNCHILHPLPGSPFGRKRVVSMAVGTLDSTVFPVDNQFGSLITADLASSIDSLGLGVPVTTGTLTSTALNIPAAIGVRNNMMGVSCHGITPYVQ